MIRLDLCLALGFGGFGLLMLVLAAWARINRDQ